MSAESFVYGFGGSGSNHNVVPYDYNDKKADSKTSKIKILKRSEPVPQCLLKPKSGVLKSKFQKNKTDAVYGESKPEGVKPKVMIN